MLAAPWLRGSALDPPVTFIPRDRPHPL